MMFRFAPAVIAMLCASSAVYAKEKKSILVLRVEAPNLDVDLVGKLDAAARQQVAASSKGAKLLPPPALDFESMKIAGGCGDDGPECLAGIGATLGATQVIRIVITSVKDKSRINFTFVRVKDKKTKTAKVDIDSLGDDAVEEFRWNVANALGDKKPQAPGGIALSSSDADALDGVEVFLDDRKYPISALKSLPPGEHRLEVHKEGYETYIWTGLVRPGRETRVQVKLDRIAGKVETPVLAAPPPVAEKPKTEKIDRTDKTDKTEKTDKLEKPKTETPPAIAAAPPPARTTPKAAPPAMTATTELPPEEDPSLIYTWVFAGSAAVATGVGVFFWRKQAGIEEDLANECMGATVEGRFVCRNQSYVSCKQDPSREPCADGRATQTATLIAFPIAGALAAAAIGAFFVEDGPMILFGAGDGGAGAAISGRF